eukprot:2786928-Pyramimonas_sp.AAC.1
MTRLARSRAPAPRWRPCDGRREAPAGKRGSRENARGHSQGRGRAQEGPPALCSWRAASKTGIGRALGQTARR